MEKEEILDYIKKLGVPYRHPHDKFYKEGNDKCEAVKPYGICDYDNEIFYHKPYPSFSCHIPGCDRTFETVIQYESHYNSCHSFTCNECKKNLPNYHLLDLHLSETHDFFFQEQAKRKPMYKCFTEECKDIFKNPQERRDHCIKIHKYPSDFRFDSARKKTGHKKKQKPKNSSEEQMDLTNTNEDDSKMDTSEQKNSKKSKKTSTFTGISFGYNPRKRVPVFSNFSKDMLKDLPQS